MNVQERIAALRRQMKKHSCDIYIVPSDDSHQSEYVGEHFKVRQFLTGFTGSAGTVVFAADSAGLWTDGRYFLQAREQLKGSGITLFCSGEKGVPTLEEYVEHNLQAGGTLGFDGRVLSMEKGLEFERISQKKGAKILHSLDLADAVWKDRPPLSDKPAFSLPASCTGEGLKDKLARVQEAMEKEGADVHILASLDDICWLTNLRGQDVSYSPLLLSYAVLTAKEARLYVDAGKLSAKDKQDLASASVRICPYEDIWKDISTLPENSKILLDPAKINYALYARFPKGASIIKKTNPTVFMKAVKNKTEIENIWNAHIKDGIAVTKFMYWLKQNIAMAENKGSAPPPTETDAADKLDALRREQKGYLGASFAPICAWGPHGAIVHYSADPQTNAPLLPGSLFLTDTGGHYMEGSTDISRTFALGDVPQHMKEDFTAVLAGNLRLANAVFLHGTCGANLDILARLPLWERGLDYRHGTGHGVGYLLNIHETPASFHTAIRKGTSAVLEPGMIITDEPGVYVEGSHGVRIENELLVTEKEETGYGLFLHFLPVTCAPIDLDAVLPGRMTAEERRWLNAYHADVYKKIAPHLSDEEREWLKIYTREI